jgi:hypothetical protein
LSGRFAFTIRDEGGKETNEGDKEKKKEGKG